MAVTLALLSPGAMAQTLPSLHEVTGVSADDVLNIREEPSGAADILGALAHNATDIEVVRENDSGTWGLVNSGEMSGWVAMRYLKPLETGDYILSRRLTCLGTEPFWSLRITQGATAVMSTPDGPEIQFTAGLVQSAIARFGRYSLRGGGGDGTFTAVIRAEYCADGMSEAEFGLDVDVLIDGGGDVAHYIGCCSLSGN
jgi:uncharacterized membrane protein